MNPNATATIYSCPQAVRWVKDSDRVIIVDERQRQTFVLQGVEATIWSWLSLRYSYARLIRLTEALLAIPPVQAEHTLRNILQQWYEQGLLETAEG